METGIELIAKERKEQIEKHGRTIESDVINNSKGQLINAANTLTSLNGPRGLERSRPKNWNADSWKKLIKKNYIDRLVIAGALIAAEIDRINRLSNQNKSE